MRLYEAPALTATKWSASRVSSALPCVCLDDMFCSQKLVSSFEQHLPSTTISQTLYQALGEKGDRDIAQDLTVWGV